MRWIEVNYSNPLMGSVTIPGSKNSVLALMAASCLAGAPVCLTNTPRITDVGVVCSILQSIGASVQNIEGTLHIDPRGIDCTYIDTQYSSAIRTAYYFIGALLAKHKKITVGYPGGDNFVSRPIDQHLKGLKALGANITFDENCYTVEAEALTGTEIYFDVITGGATINLMLAAVLAKGKTVLHNAARDPEVVDTAILLNKMGARIFGAGTHTIRIQGVSELGGCVHSVIPDRLIAGSYLMAAGVTKGKITIEDIIPEHLEACMDKLSEIGLDFQVSDTSITAAGGDTIKATRIRTGKYPMFETDFQQPVTSLLLLAEGRSIIADRIYPQRFNHCEQLKRMGADISVRNGVARINSRRELKGNWVRANDIRAGTCLILAGLIAEGTTCITGIEHLERGYEDVIGDFQALGAKIQLCQSEDYTDKIDIEIQSVPC